MTKSLRLRPLLQAFALTGFVAATTAPAEAGILDTLFGKGAVSEPAATDAAAVKRNRRTEWDIGDYSSVRVIPREAGGAANQQPQELTPEQIRGALTSVRYAQPVTATRTQPLFAADEITALVDPLVQAFVNAGPEQDVVVLSTSRREAGIITEPLGVTARLFVQGGQLNIIVHDTRLAFVDRYRGTHTLPVFQFGSRSAASAGVAISSAIGTSRRPDWLQIGLAAAPADASAAAAPRAAAAAAAAAPVAAAPAAVAAPAPINPKHQEIEQRLETLKRLFDKGLITQEEYQQKRKEVLQAL